MLMNLPGNGEPPVITLNTPSSPRTRQTYCPNPTASAAPLRLSRINLHPSAGRSIMVGGGSKKERPSSGVLGRALVRHHNHMIREAKEKGATLRKQQRQLGGALESITDLSDIDLVLENAEEASRVYSASNPSPSLRIDLDGVPVVVNEKRKQQKEEEELHASSLQVPRRPPWQANMSVDELHANEKQAFLAWRRTLARLEGNEKLVLTPFEKNLDVWRQLWRVLERSDLIVMVVDARDPLFYRCPDLETYALEIDEHKRTMLLVNKADLLPLTIRRRWARYFREHGILYVFWSAKVASTALEGKKKTNDIQESSQDADSKIYSRNELLARLQAEAEAIVQKRNSSKENNGLSKNSDGTLAVKQVIVGFVGYPNVGKSSTINALVGEKRTGVTSTPGKTKHFQTLIISDELMLCDCPGLVFPSFSSSRYEMIASGVLPIDRMTEHREAVQVVANRVPRGIIENIYNIVLPKPKPYESQSRPPLGSELLRAYCSSRGYVGASGLPDETRAARLILKDYIDGKLPHFAVPPVDEGDNAEQEDGRLCSDSMADNALKSRESDDSRSSIEESDASDSPDIHDLLDDLKSFDIASGMPPAGAAEKKKKPVASHKHHRKPQRKKDRSWRVANDGGDGMPVVRVFQKPAVNLASITSSV